MKKSFSLILLLFIHFGGFSQTYSSPESLEFDYSNDRWLISNKSANNILARSSATGDLTIFATGISSPHGIEIANDTVYVCSGSSLRAFELSTGAPVFSINLGATYLNGITHDSTYLYITDFSAKVIYRFNMQTRDFAVYIPGLAKSPNGIIFDSINNRCVFVNWGSNAPVMAFDVTTGAVSTITPTTLSNCDGIAIDGARNFYISSWGLNGISKFDNSFSFPPLTVVTSLSNPADIFYNVISDTLGVANSGSMSNTTYHYFGTSTGLVDILPLHYSFDISPNPILNAAAVSFELSERTEISLSIYDLKGQLVQTLFEGNMETGKHEVNFLRNNLTNGTYLIKMSGLNLMETKKLIFLD